MSITQELYTHAKKRIPGAHKLIGVDPDIATFAKALGNGHPIGAVIGTREAIGGPVCLSGFKRLLD